MQVGKEKTRKKQKQKQNRQETNNWSPPFVFFFKKRCVVSPFLSFKRFAHFPALEPWGRRSQGVNSSKGSPCLWISKLNHNFKNLNLFFFFFGGGRGWCYCVFLEGGVTIVPGGWWVVIVEQVSVLLFFPWFGHDHAPAGGSTGSFSHTKKVIEIFTALSSSGAKKNLKDIGLPWVYKRCIYSDLGGF